MSRAPSSESHHHELYHLNITNSWRSVSSISQLYYSNFNGLYHLKCHELYHPNLALTSSIIWISDTLSHLHLNSISSTSHELYLLYQSRRRPDSKCLDLQIFQLSWILFWMTGTPFTQVKIFLKFWGLPRKRVSYVRGLLWKRVGNFGIRNYF